MREQTAPQATCAANSTMTCQNIMCSHSSAATWPHARASDFRTGRHVVFIVRTDTLDVLLLVCSHFGSSHFGSRSHFCSNFCLLTRERRGFFCVSGIFRSITAGDAKFETMAAERQSSWVEHSRRSSASSLAPRFARSPSTVSSMATWAHRSERGSEVNTETDHEDCRTSSFRGCVRETVPGERPCDEDQTCTSSFGRHRRS